MAIVAECAVCGKRFKADEKQAGKKAKCSQCGTVFVIGGGATAEATPMTAAGPRAASSTVAATAAVKIKTAAAPALIATAEPSAQPDGIATQVVAKPAAKAVARPTQTDLGPVAMIPEPSATRATAPAPAKRNLGRVAAIAAALVLVAGASAVIVPKLLNAKSNPPGDAGRPSTTDNPDARVVNHVIPVGIANTGPAWSTEPDAPAVALKLPDDFRLALPGQPPLRHNPASIVCAAAPSPYAAVTLLPDADLAQPVIEVWNLSAKRKTAQFKLQPDRQLTAAALSQDGGYYAGHWYDATARVNHVEVWSATNGTIVHVIDVPATAPVNAPIVLGFPLEDQLAIVGERVQVWDLNSKKPVREVALPSPRTDDTLAAASAKLKLIAVADSKSLALIDLNKRALVGKASIPDAAVAHPRKRLALRGIAFSPDGAELALSFDNRQSTRRIAVFDVATGSLKALLTPAAPVLAGGPDLQWSADSRAFLVGSGVMLDRTTGRQIGQIYGNLADEGLGGILSGLLDDGRAMLLWDKYPSSLVLRAAPVRREQPGWIDVKLNAARATRHAQLQCVAPHFGNLTAAQSLLQTGRLTDGSQFLVVDLEFTASLASDAPPMLSLRQDQFMLVADGHARLPIGILTADGNFSLEKPEYDLSKGPAIPRKRSIVFAATGQEKSLAVRIAGAESPLAAPLVADPTTQPAPALAPVAAERADPLLFRTPDASGAVSVRIAAARLRPFDYEPDAADHVPLRVTYSAPQQGLLAVTFDLTVNTARTISRGNRGDPPGLRLLTPDGILVRPSVELPGMLPPILSAGERRTHTCLFVVDSQSPASRYRLTYDGAPVATITPEPPTAQTTP